MRFNRRLIATYILFLSLSRDRLPRISFTTDPLGWNNVISPSLYLSAAIITTFDTKNDFFGLFYLFCNVLFFLLVICQLSQEDWHFVNTRSTNNHVIRIVNQLQARIHSCSIFSRYESVRHIRPTGVTTFSLFFYFFPGDRGELIRSHGARNNSETAQLKPSNGYTPQVSSGSLRKDA